MTRRWVVRLLADDGTAVEGRLHVGDEELTFQPGMQGAMVPALVIGRERIARVEQVHHGLVHHVELTLVDGERVVFDNGLRATSDLAEVLSR